MPPCELGGVSTTRLITPGDAPVLAELLRASRDFLAPWEPVHGDGYFTAGGQDHAMYQLVSTIPS